MSSFSDLLDGFDPDNEGAADAPVENASEAMLARSETGTDAEKSINDTNSTSAVAATTKDAEANALARLDARPALPAANSATDRAKDLNNAGDGDENVGVSAGAHFDDVDRDGGNDSPTVTHTGGDSGEPHAASDGRPVTALRTAVDVPAPVDGSNAAPPASKSSKSSYLPPRIAELHEAIEALEAELDEHLDAERYDEAKAVRRKMGNLRLELKPLEKRRERQVRRDKNRRAAGHANPLDPRIIEHHATWTDEQILNEFNKELRADESGKGLVAGVAWRLGTAAVRSGRHLDSILHKEQTFAECYKEMVRVYGSGRLFGVRGNEIIRRRWADKPEQLAKAPWLKRHPIPTAEAYRVGKFEDDWQKKWLGRWKPVFDARAADGDAAYPWEQKSSESDPMNTEGR